MKKISLVVGIIAILVGLLLFLIGSVAGGVVLLILGALNLFLFTRKPRQAVAALEPEPEKPRVLQKEVAAFTVSGHEYYQKILAEFLTEENYEYTLSKSELIDLDYRAYEFDPYITTPELVPEPDNQYDANAIAVMVDGVRIGYVPRNHQSEVIPYMNDPEITQEVEIYGGNYKKAELNDDYDDINGPTAADYTIIRESTPYKASVRLYKTV